MVFKLSQPCVCKASLTLVKENRERETMEILIMKSIEMMLWSRLETGKERKMFLYSNFKNV